MLKKAIITLALILVVTAFIFIRQQPAPHSATVYPEAAANLWSVRSIDTMKYSRDLAKSKLADPTFDAVIDTQLTAIKNAGANYVAIGTPYDQEFLPFLRRWVSAARQHQLAVWFRGNWSGWEGWFDHPFISQSEHIKKTVAFVTSNSDLFKTGDIFTPCPECENGHLGDPRFVGEVADYRTFLRELKDQTQKAFDKINKTVSVGYFSMNGDVAALVMDPPTTNALDDTVVVDHYVYSPQTLVADIKVMAEASHGNVVLGEFGAPISDIHGKFSQAQQADWITELLDGLARTPAVTGLNYWVSFGGSTQLWNEDGSSREAVSALAAFYQPASLRGQVVDSRNHPIKDALVKTKYRQTFTDSHGYFVLPFVVGENKNFEVSSAGFSSKTVTVFNLDDINEIELISLNQTIFDRVQQWFK